MDTIVEKKGFGTRIGNSVKGIFGGIIFILIGIGLLIFNEVNSVRNIKKVKELRESYVEVKSDVVNKEYEGKLIVTSGKLDFADQELKDETFNITIKTPIMERKVEMYQWKETKTETDEKVTYEYEKVWDDSVIKSSEFKDASSHSNPTSMPYNSGSKRADSLKVGAYKLSDSVQNKVGTNHTLNNFEGANIPEGYEVKGEYITNTKNTSSPEIGDIRISFTYGDYNEVTVMGKQSGEVVGDYKTSNGKTVSVFEDGVKTGEELIDDIATTDSIIRWVLRLVGAILIIAGVGSLFGILKTVSSYVPILGGLVNGVIGLISILIGLAISFVVIAITWVVVRPLLGILLLVIAGAIIALVVTFIKKKKKNAPVEQPVQQQYFQQAGVQQGTANVQQFQPTGVQQGTPNVQQYQPTDPNQTNNQNPQQ